MPVRGYRTITIRETIYNVLMELKRAKELERGHEVSMNELLAEILKWYREHAPELAQVEEEEEE